MKIKHVTISQFIILFFCACTLLQCTFTPENKAQKKGDVFSQFYEKPVAPKIPNHDPVLMEIKECLDLYTAGNYKEAAAKFEQTAINAPQKDQWIIRLYWGICHLELNETKEALTYLNQVEPQSDYGDQALWYRGLTHLKAQQIDAAKSVFRQIAKQENSIYQKSANQILNQIKETPSE